VDFTGRMLHGGKVGEICSGKLVIRMEIYTFDYF